MPRRLLSLRVAGRLRTALASILRGCASSSSVNRREVGERMRQIRRPHLAPFHLVRPRGALVAAIVTFVAGAASAQTPTPTPIPPTPPDCSTFEYDQRPKSLGWSTVVKY